MTVSDHGQFDTSRSHEIGRVLLALPIWIFFPRFYLYLQWNWTDSVFISPMNYDVIGVFVFRIAFLFLIMCVYFNIEIVNNSSYSSKWINWHAKQHFIVLRLFFFDEQERAQPFYFCTCLHKNAELYGSMA